MIKKNLPIIIIISIGIVYCIIYSIGYSTFFENKIFNELNQNEQNYVINIDESEEKLQSYIESKMKNEGELEKEKQRNEELNEKLKIEQLSQKENVERGNCQYYEENGKCYTIEKEKKEKVEIITPSKAWEIALEESKDQKYQYREWESKYYIGQEENRPTITLKSLLDSNSKEACWKEEWKTEKFNNQMLWKVKLYDEKDENTKLYIYIDAKTGDILGAGKSNK